MIGRMTSVRRLIRGMIITRLTDADPQGMATMPHCDSAILHSPGTCRYCDQYPDWQQYREVARIAFSNEPVTDEKSPCPSLWFRPGHIRDRWHGNVVHMVQEEP